MPKLGDPSNICTLPPEHFLVQIDDLGQICGRSELAHRGLPSRILWLRPVAGRQKTRKENVPYG